jgi:hypothetical protein
LVGRSRAHHLVDTGGAINNRKLGVQAQVNKPGAIVGKAI